MSCDKDKDEYSFLVEKQLEPMPGIRQFYGYASRVGGGGVKFYLTSSTYSISLSVQPTEEGKRLITYFTNQLGEPTLKYNDKNEGLNVDDYTAQWFIGADKEVTVEMIQRHLMGGFTPEELPL